MNVEHAVLLCTADGTYACYCFVMKECCLWLLLRGATALQSKVVILFALVALQAPEKADFRPYLQAGGGWRSTALSQPLLGVWCCIHISRSPTHMALLCSRAVANPAAMMICRPHFLICYTSVHKLLSSTVPQLLTQPAVAMCTHVIALNPWLLLLEGAVCSHIGRLGVSALVTS